MGHAPFPIQPELTAIAIGYRNNKLIADDVLPRVPVGTQDFKYLTFNKADAFTVPDTKVGRKSKPNQVEFGATESTASTMDYGLDNPVPQADIENAPVNFNPLGRAVMGTTDLVLLDREIRTANLVFAAGTYPAGNKSTLSGTSQWSDFTNSNPIDAILIALDACIMRPNVLTLGRAVWTKLCQHPKMVKAIYGNNTDVGIVTRQQVAGLLELEEVVVGEGWVNTAKKGQTPTFVRAWGKHASLTLRNKNVDPTGSQPAFGYTAQWGDRIAGSWEDKNIGLRGGQMVRMGESVKELITASDLAYFFENAIA